MIFERDFQSPKNNFFPATSLQIFASDSIESESNLLFNSKISDYELS
jgi:hypothetical protein